MKSVQITIKFNISEKNYHSNEFQKGLYGIRSGEYKKKFIDSGIYGMRNAKITLKTS